MRLSEVFGSGYSTVWHVTPRVNVARIMKNGLDPKRGPRSKRADERLPSIYTFPDGLSMNDAMSNWLSDQFDESTVLSILELTVPSTWLIFDTVRWEARILQSVPPDMIKLLVSDVDAWDGSYPNEAPPPNWHSVE